MVRNTVINMEMIRFDRLVPKDMFERFTREINSHEAVMKMRKGWVCTHCGKSTYDTDHDGLVDFSLHLACALEREKN